jgi:hypothetical protein
VKTIFVADDPKPWDWAAMYQAPAAGTDATITLSALGLRRLLEDTLVAAEQDPETPYLMLAGVLLHTDRRGEDTVLVGTASDRFLLAQASEKANGDLPETFLAVPQVRVLLAALRVAMTTSGQWAAYGDSWPVDEGMEDGGDVRLVRRGDEVTLERPCYGTVTVSVTPQTFPAKLRKLFDNDGGFAGEMLLAQYWMRILVDIARRRDEAPLAIQCTGYYSPVQIRIGDSFRALLMPHPRKSEDEVVAPVFAPPSQQTHTQ